MSWARTARFHSQFATLLASGLPLPRAAELAGDAAGGPWCGRSRRIAADCAAGRGVAEAFAAAGEGPLAVALIRAGEVGGALPETHRRIAALYEEWHTTRREVLGRLVYPVILLHAGLLFPLVPALVLGTDGPLSLVLRLTCLWLPVLALAFGIRTAWRNGLGAQLALRWPLSFLALPLITANACAALRATLGAGLRIQESFALAADACGNRVMAERLRAAGADLETHRQPDIAAALTACGWDRQHIALVAAGEAGGSTDQALVHAQVAAREQFSWRLQWSARMFTGAVYVLGLLIAAAAILGMYQSVYGGSAAEMGQE